MYKYKIIKKGRKWFQAETVDNNKYKAQIEINEISKDWAIDSIVEFDGKFEKKESYGHTKVFIYPCSAEQKQEQIKQAKEAKEQQEINKWLGYVENKTEYVYWNGVNELKKFNLNDEQKKRLDKAIETTTINQAKSKINDYFYYIKKSINENRWYDNGEKTVLDNIKILEKYNVDCTEYKNKLDELKNTLKVEKEERRKLDLIRYFEISDLSVCKGDEYTIGNIVKNKDGKLGKIVKTWKYYEPDTMSFGYMVDGGWIKNAKCDMEAVTEAEKTEYERKEKEKELREEKEAEERAIKKELKGNINKLFDYIKDNGEYPERPESEFIIVDGEVLFNDFTIYGGGSEIKIDNDKIWAIRNNGMDGDNWSYNNIKTGGAGAIGHFIKIDKTCIEYINKIKELEEKVNE
jgi:hypothetical protein